MEAATEKLIVKDGKFYRGDTYIQPEHGNLEQIECLKENNKKGDILKEGLIVNPHYDEPREIETWVNFECVCGQSLRKRTTADEEGDHCCYVDKTVTCPKCKRMYIFEENEDYDLIVKLNK